MRLEILLILGGVVLAGKAVGVVAVGQQQQLYVHPLGQEHVDTALAGVDAGFVAVEDDGDIARHAVDEAYLVGGECGTRRRHYVLHPHLVHGHHIGISLHEIAQVLSADGFLGLEEAEELLAFAIDDAFRRVEVFHVYALGGCVEHAPAEACHASAHAEDGPDDASTEAVAPRAVLVLDAQAGADTVLRVVFVNRIDKVLLLVSGLESVLGHAV